MHRKFTAKERKQHSERMKQVWAKKRALREAQTTEQKEAYRLCIYVNNPNTGDLTVEEATAGALHELIPAVLDAVYGGNYIHRIDILHA